MNNLLYRFHQKGDSYIKNHRCHNSGIDILQPAMSKGMFFIRRLGGIVKGHHEKHHRTHVGNIIESIAHDGKETTLPACQYFENTQHKVHQKAHQSCHKSSFRSVPVRTGK